MKVYILHILLLIVYLSTACRVQVGEYVMPSLVVVHKPGIEISTGKLHPAGALYEKLTSNQGAENAHLNLLKVFKEFNIPHITVDNALKMLPHHEVVDLAMKAVSLRYRLDGDVPINNNITYDMLSSDYKYAAISALPYNELVELVLLRPTVYLAPDDKNTFVTITRTEVRPMLNMVFTRDQQIITAKGVVLCNLNSPQRAREVGVMEKVWKGLGVDLVGRIRSPGKVEGGDYFTINQSLALIAQGLRTNEAGIQQLLDNDWVGTEKVVVVVDEYDQDQERMHLDTYFNVVKQGVCVMEENVLLADSISKYRRTIKEYTRTKNGKYSLTLSGVSFPDYVQNYMQWKVIGVPKKDQQAYMINFLNVGDNRIISVHPELESLLHKHGVRDVTVRTIDYSGVTAMYGAARCSTQVFRCPPKNDILPETTHISPNCSGNNVTVSPFMMHKNSFSQ